MFLDRRNVIPSREPVSSKWPRLSSSHSKVYYYIRITILLCCNFHSYNMSQVRTEIPIFYLRDGDYTGDFECDEGARATSLAGGHSVICMTIQV